jgi:transposase-like protein
MRFSEEEKRKAVKLFNDGCSINYICCNIGCSQQSLYIWRKKFSQPQEVDLQEENRLLKELLAFYMR